MGSLEPAAFYAQFSGTWTAAAETGQEVRDALSPAEGAGGQARGGTGRPRGGGVGGGGVGGGGFPGAGGGASRGGGPGGRGRTAGAGGPGTDIGPARLRTAMELAAAVPPTLGLDLRGDSVFVTGLAEHPLRLLHDADPVPMVAQGQRVEVRAQWDGGDLVLRRSSDDVTIVDRYEPVGGDRLLVHRTVELPVGGQREAAWAYRRADP